MKDERLMVECLQEMVGNTGEVTYEFNFRRDPGVQMPIS